jgi:putative membrane protein
LTRIVIPAKAGTQGMQEGPCVAATHAAQRGNAPPAHRSKALGPRLRGDDEGSPGSDAAAGMASGVLCSAPMLKLIAKWLLSASALLFVAYVYQGVQVTSFPSAMLAALVIGLLNAVVRPVLVVLTLPVTVVTLGLFLFVINALVFWAAAAVLDGFGVRDFVAALVGSLIYTALGVVIESALERLFTKQ